MRNLVLRKESLTELTVDELGRIVGADSVTPAQTRVYTICTDPLSLGCHSWQTEQC
ncbi:MAG TPA: hypothetical protein VNQ77_05320 [Frankiaceae bacterium]|nr:hypothetical protein [Frankiaceae bacterium]